MMRNTLVLVAGLAVAAAVVVVSGLLLSRAGKPYGTALLNVHKLVDLGAVAVIGATLYRVAGSAPLSPLESALVVLAGLAVIAAFSSGGVVSAADAAPVWVLSLHRIGGWGAAVLAAIVVYLAAIRT